MKTFGYRCQATIEELFGEILVSGQITRRHRYRLRSALLSNTLTSDHHDIINRLLYSTKRGKLKIRD